MLVIVMISTVFAESTFTQPYNATSMKRISLKVANHTVNSVLCYETNECSRSGSCLFALEETIAIFSVGSVTACKMYCWYHKNCATFAFQSQKSTCSLHSGFPSDTFHKDGYHVPVVGDINCLKNFERSPSVPCRTIGSISQVSQGVLIKDVRSTLCLGFGKLNNLKWKDCALATPWKIEIGASRSRDVRCKIVQADSLDLCFEATMDNQDSMRFISVVSCEDGNENQLFQINSGTIHELQNMADSEENDNACFFSFTNFGWRLFPDSSHDDVSLGTVSLLKPEEHLALCQRSKLEAAHSDVQGDTPFFLPGEPIPITCTPGYGVKENSSSVTCRNDETRPDKCVELEVKLRQCQEKTPLIIMLVSTNIGLTLIVSMFIAWILALSSKIRALRAGRGFAEEEKINSNDVKVSIVNSE